MTYEKYVGCNGSTFEDEDGLGLEFVFNDCDAGFGFTHGHIPAWHSIKDFYNVEIRV